MAVVRARESRREDRLFNDPYAQAFVDAAPGAFPEELTSAKDLAALGPLATLGEMFSLHAVVRTRFLTTTSSPRPLRIAGRLCCSPQGSTRAPSGCPGRTT